MGYLLLLQVESANVLGKTLGVTPRAYRFTEAKLLNGFGVASAAAAGVTRHRRLHTMYIHKRPHCAELSKNAFR